MKVFSIKNGGLVFGLLVIVACVRCQVGRTTRVIKLAHVLDIEHPVHRAMVFMADKVAEKSGHRLRVDIYPAGQLGGGERDLIELLQIGSLAMTKVSTAPLETFVPEMKLFGMPYLFRDDDHRWKVLNGEIGKQLLQAGEKYFLHGMCYYDAGSRSFYTKGTPIEKPENLRGLKIRVMNSLTSIEMVRAFGGSATPIPWGELYTALQQGVVDGAENNPPSFYLSHHYEVCRYYCLDEHTSVPDILLMSTVVWESLSPQEQKWIDEAVDESVRFQRQLWNETCEKILRDVQAAGVTITRPDKRPFRESVRQIYDSCQKENPDLYRLVQQIQNIR